MGQFVQNEGLGILPNIFQHETGVPWKGVAVAWCAEGGFQITIGLVIGKERKEDNFRKRVTRARTGKLIGFLVQFFGLNLIGVLASRAFASAEFQVNADGTTAERWTWMTSFYKGNYTLINKRKWSFII